MENIDKEIIKQKIQSRENWIRKAQSNIKLYLSEIEQLEKQLNKCSMVEIEQELFNKDRNDYECNK